MTTRPRDSQRAKFYKAYWTLPKGRPLRDLVTAQKYLDTLHSRAAWRKEGIGYFTVGNQKSQALIQISTTNGTDERYVLLQIAHAKARRWGWAWHGREVARLFLVLVDLAMGPSVAADLRKAYAENGVRHQAKRKGRKLTDEQAAVLAGRLREHQQKRQAAKDQPSREATDFIERILRSEGGAAGPDDNWRSDPRRFR